MVPLRLSREHAIPRSRFRPRCLGTLMVFAALAGCGEASKKDMAMAVGEAKPAQAQAAREVDVKKIIYEGQIESVVEDVDPVVERVRTLAQQNEGYIASSEIDRTYGTHRAAKFTIRVPAAKYETLREEFAKLGNTLRNSSKSDDVTDEYTDLEARIRILKKEESALEELLGKSAGHLEDLLRVRDQLVRNREQIEKGEGRIKLLASKVAYSTIVLTLRETKDYVPPTAPTFGNDIDSTFTRSVQALYDLAKGIVLFAVGLAPWLPLILLGAWLARRSVRMVRRKE